jgi:hypothetical protein
MYYTGKIVIWTFYIGEDIDCDLLGYDKVQPSLDKNIPEKTVVSTFSV